MPKKSPSVWHLNTLLKRARKNHHVSGKQKILIVHFRHLVWHKKTKCLSQIKLPSVWHWIKWLKFEKKVSKKEAKSPSVWHWVKLLQSEKIVSKKEAKLPSVWHWVKRLKFEKKCLKKRPEKITKCLEKQKNFNCLF